MFDLVLNTPLSYIVYSANLNLISNHYFMFWILLFVYPEGKYPPCKTFSPKKYQAGYINPFVANEPFLYLLKTLENLNIFWCFQGVEKGFTGNKWVNLFQTMLHFYTLLSGGVEMEHLLEIGLDSFQNQKKIDL